MGGTGPTTSRKSRAQSNPIAVVLIFGLVIASAMTIVGLGASAITTTQDQLGAKNAETKMAQLDSQVATVALGSSRNQTVSLGTSSNYAVDSTAGHMEIRFSNTSVDEQLLETSLGAVTYESEDGQRVAYQGGGVWRAGPDGGSVMVAPPELHYRSGTLTLPLVTVGNDATFNGDAVIRQNNTKKVYPNETMANPLTDGEVTIRITSRYHEAWESYIDSRTEGSVEDSNPDDQTITVKLTVPTTETFDQSVAATSDDSDAIDDSSTSPNGGFESPIDTGVDAPAADNLIQEKIDYCNADPANCQSLPGGGTVTDGTYYSTTGATLTDVDFDTGGGDIVLVVDGPLDWDGSSHTVTGGGDVTIYVTGSVDVGGSTNVNTGGDPAKLLTIVDTGASEIEIRGTSQYTGLFYAPGTSLKMRGGGNPSINNLVGATVVEDATANGNGDVKFESTTDFELDFASTATINYLHVSENSVNVTAD